VPVGYDKKPSVRHAGEDSLEANLCKACVGLMTGTVIGLGWVLRRERRVPLMGKIAGTALVSALGVGPRGTPPAIVADGGHGAEYGKDGEDWRVKRGEQVSRVLANK